MFFCRWFYVCELHRFIETCHRWFLYNKDAFFICELHCFIETCQRWFLYNNDVFLYVNYIVDASLQGDGNVETRQCNLKYKHTLTRILRWMKKIL